MPFAFTPYHLPLVISAAMLAALAAVTWRQLASEVARVLLGVILLALAWVVIYALDIATADLRTKVMLLALRTPVFAGLAVSLFVIAAFHSGHRRWVSRRFISVLLVPAVVAFVFAVTSEHHPYWRTAYGVRLDSAVPVLTYRREIGHWLNAVWSFGLLSAAIVQLVQAGRDSPALNARRGALMSAALLCSLVPQVLFELGFSPIPGYNLAPSLLGVSFLFFVWPALRQRVIELVPIARSAVVDQLRDVVLVLDARDIVVDANRAALDALHLPAHQAVGRDAQELLARWGLNLYDYRGQPAVHQELATGVGSPGRVLDLSITQIEPEREGAPSRGRIIVLRDITERALAREASSSAAALDAQREAEERIRREIAELLHTRIQNQLLSVVFQLSEVEHLWKDAPPEVVAHLRSIRDNLDRIRDREVRIASHRLYPALLDMGLAPALHMLGERYQPHFAMAYSVSPVFSALDAPLDNKLPMALRETIYRVVEEALSNAQRHAGASRVTVTLGLTGVEPNRVTVAVADNGRGADPAAIKQRLGLRTVEARVRNLGGTWRLVTAPGEGTTLSVELPLAVQPAPADAPQPQFA